MNCPRTLARVPDSDHGARRRTAGGARTPLGPDVRHGLGVILRPSPLGPACGQGDCLAMHFARLGMSVKVSTSARPRTPRVAPLLVARSRAATGA